jgi:hypothetical protein
MSKPSKKRATSSWVFIVGFVEPFYMRRYAPEYRILYLVPSCSIRQTGLNKENREKLLPENDCK